MRLSLKLAVALMLVGCGPVAGHGASLSKPQATAATTLPNPAQTPGTLCTPSNPNFKEYRYAEHIAYCNRNVTSQMKDEIGAAYGIVRADWPNYEFDHYLPLAIGGSSDVANLWPQPKGEALDKDKLENQLYHDMAAGTVSQADAVAQIRAWQYNAGH